MIRASTDRDMAIMDLLDAGESVDDVAQAMGISPVRVAGVASYMRPGKSDRATSKPVVMKASARLLAAIARYHPDKVATPEPARAG